MRPEGVAAPSRPACFDAGSGSDIRYLCRAALLVVDEIGYLPIVPGGGNLFFELVNAQLTSEGR